MGHPDNLEGRVAQFLSTDVLLLPLLLLLVVCSGSLQASQALIPSCATLYSCLSGDVCLLREDRSRQADSC